VIDCGDRAIGEKDFELAIAQHGKRLRAGHFMNQVQPDE
jgi:hypothetical protein